MSLEHPYFFTILKPSDLKIPEILRLAIGRPTKVKIQQVLSQYTQPNSVLLGCFLKNQMRGLIGLKMSESEKAIILHLAVLKKYQNQGIGRALIQEALKRFHLKWLETETDLESVEFYLKCGFTAYRFEGFYNERFVCHLKLDSSFSA